jgi:hypothetical protein
MELLEVKRCEKENAPRKRKQLDCRKYGDIAPSKK